MNIAEKIKHDDWVQGLKPGDEVLASRRTAGRFGHRYGEISKVAKITATQVVLKNGWRFGRTRNVGSLLESGAYGDIRPVEQEDRDRIEHTALLLWIDRMPPGPVNGWKKPPLPVLRAMKEAHDKAMAEITPGDGAAS